MTNRSGKSGNSDIFYFLELQKSLNGNWSHEIKRCFLLGSKPMTNLDSVLKSRQHFANQGPYSQNYGFSSSHVHMWELDLKEGWVTKDWHLWLMVRKKTLVCSMDHREIKPVNPNKNQSWIFTGRTDTEAETPILWPPDVNSQLTGMTLILGNWHLLYFMLFLTFQSTLIVHACPLCGEIQY